MTLTSDVKSRVSKLVMAAPEVRSILYGHKGSFRREVVAPYGWKVVDWDVRVDRSLTVRKDRGGEERRLWCPYGIPGDRIKVKESVAVRRHGADPKIDLDKALHYIHYRAEYEGNLDDEWHRYDGWIPASKMPMWACRIELEVTEVRVGVLIGRPSWVVEFARVKPPEAS